MVKLGDIETKLKAVNKELPIELLKKFLKLRLIFIRSNQRQVQRIRLEQSLHHPLHILSGHRVNRL